jgi:hypothetical protein
VPAWGTYLPGDDHARRRTMALYLTVPNSHASRLMPSPPSSAWRTPPRYRQGTLQPVTILSRQSACSHPPSRSAHAWRQGRIPLSQNTTAITIGKVDGQSTTKPLLCDKMASRVSGAVVLTIKDFASPLSSRK